MKKIGAVLLLVCGLACLSACGPAQRIFHVSSYPPGARVFVDGEERGQTDMRRLKVVFYPETHATLRVEMNGFQSEGVVLQPNAPQRLDFMLQRAPAPAATQKKLDEIQAQVEQILIQVQDNQQED
jgi:hypothetical protein